jgi:hypothetical protein
MFVNRTMEPGSAIPMSSASTGLHSKSKSSDPIPVHSVPIAAAAAAEELPSRAPTREVATRIVYLLPMNLLEVSYWGEIVMPRDLPQSWVVSSRGWKQAFEES